MGGITLTVQLITTSGLLVYRKSYILTLYIDFELICVDRKDRTRYLLICCPRILTASSIKRPACWGRRTYPKNLIQTRKSLRRQNRNELFEPFVFMFCSLLSVFVYLTSKRLLAPEESGVSNPELRTGVFAEGQSLNANSVVYISHSLAGEIDILSLE